MTDKAMTPWRHSRMGGVMSHVWVVLALLAMCAGLAGIFSGSARADGFEQCKSFMMIGDANGIGDQGNGLEEAMRKKGVSKIDFETASGRNLDDEAKKLSSIALDGKCLIVEGGSANLQAQPQEIRRSIDALLNAAKGAKKIYWVTPVTNPTKAKWNDETFKSELNKTSAPNLVKIDTTRIKDNPDWYDKSGITMTNPGYTERIKLIVDAITKDGGETPSSSSSSPSSSSGNDGGNNSGNNGGNNGGNSNGGGQTVPQGNDALTNSMSAPEETFFQSSDGYVGDASKISPLAYANQAKRMVKYSSAVNYLAIQRWDAPPVPTPQLNIVDPETYKSMMIGPMVDTPMKMGATAAKIAFMIVMFAFTSDMASGSLAMADTIFGQVLGGAYSSSNDGRWGILFGSLITVAMIFAGVRAFGTPRALANPKGAVTSFAISVGKFLMMITLILFMAHQSAKNFKSNPGNVVEQMVNNRSTKGDEDGTNGDIMKAKDTQIPDQDSDFYSKRAISSPSSWQGLSLGWVVSFVYYIGSMLAQSLLKIINVFIMTPLDMLRSNVKEAVAGVEPTACDRYVDGLHQAFETTPAAEHARSTSMVLSMLDYVYVDYYYRGYSSIYGGKTYSAGNSWCWSSEQNRGTPSGEWLMIGRSAALYKQVAGTGNLLSNDRRYANGRHSYVSAEANLENGIGGNPDGYLVKGDGNWVSDTPENALPSRADSYMGSNNGPRGNTQAKYYFAACGWTPQGDKAILHPDWQHVRAMGPSGEGTVIPLDSDKREPNGKLKDYGAAIKDSEMEFEKSNMLMDKFDTEKYNKVIPPSKDKADAGFAAKSSDAMNWKTRMFLQQYDCDNPRLYDIGAEDDRENFGFGGKNIWSQRWDYAPIAPPNLAGLLGNLTKDAVGSGTVNMLSGIGSFLDNPLGVTGGAIKGAWSGAKDEAIDDLKSGRDGVMEFFGLKEKDEDKIEEPSDEDYKKMVDAYQDRDSSPLWNPETKFGSSKSPEGVYYAQNFWLWSNGSHLDTAMIVTVLILLISIALLILVIPAALIGLVVNLILALCFGFLPFIIMIILFSYLFRPHKAGK